MLAPLSFGSSVNIVVSTTLRIGGLNTGSILTCVHAIPAAVPHNICRVRNAMLSCCCFVQSYDVFHASLISKTKVRYVLKFEASRVCVGLRREAAQACMLACAGNLRHGFTTTVAANVFQWTHTDASSYAESVSLRRGRSNAGSAAVCAVRSSRSRAVRLAQT